MSMLKFLEKASNRCSDNILADVFKALNYWPIVSTGDGRYDSFKGMVTSDPTWIALVHLTEHGSINFMTVDQALTIVKMLANDINNRRQKTLYDSDGSYRKGAKFGLLGNVTKMIPARGVDCKFYWEIYPIKNDNGNVGLWFCGQNYKMLVGITSDNQVIGGKQFHYTGKELW